MTAYDDSTFAEWQGFYRDDTGKRATLGILIRSGHIVLATTTGERLHLTPLETGLLIDGLAAAIRAAGPIP